MVRIQEKKGDLQSGIVIFKKKRKEVDKGGAIDQQFVESLDQVNRSEVFDHDSRAKLCPRSKE